MRKNLINDPVRFGNLVQLVGKNITNKTDQYKHAMPFIEIIQRHYPSQSAKAIVDAKLVFDIRVVKRMTKSRVKYQPEWLNAAYNVLQHKHSNI